VQEIERVADGGRVVHVETDQLTAAACPAFGMFSKRRPPAAEPAPSASGATLYPS